MNRVSRFCPLFALGGRRRKAIGALLLVGAAGCIGQRLETAATPNIVTMPAPFLLDNPARIPRIPEDQLWDQLVDIVDDYFLIAREQRIRQVGDILTEGRIDTYPRSGSTVLEPWNRDAATPYEQWEGTLQSVRRKAMIRVTPAENSFLVEVVIDKELEDVASPTARAGNALLRNDNSLERGSRGSLHDPLTLGWLPLGRDVALEQQILSAIQTRFGAAPREAVPREQTY